jgi:pimeloyl-ACP methyl ester carboxylesterase
MREIWLDIEGVRLFAVEAGAGPAMVLLHGAMADHMAVLQLLRPLSARYRVIAPDLRGSGRSVSGETLDFDRLADDVMALLDHLRLDAAVIGGVSSGTGVALRCALRHPARTARLVLVTPVYGGGELGYTEQQRATFAMMDAMASRAPTEGVQVLRPLYANLPADIRERALAMLGSFDAASVAATSRFVASGAQPFRSAADLEVLRTPTLLIRGNDPVHPAAVSDLYASSIPDCTALPATTTDVAGAIDQFCSPSAAMPH